MLNGVDWYLDIDVAGQLISPILKGEAFLLDCLALDGTDRLSQNVGN